MKTEFIIDQKDLQAVLDSFKKLPDEVRRRHLHAAERRAANPLRRQMQTEAKKHMGPTGNLYKSIGNKTGRSKENPRIFVGARMGRSYKGWHAHWIELGTQNRVQKTTGRRTGKVTKDPFFTRSYEAKKDLVLRNLEREVERELARAIAKHF